MVEYNSATKTLIEIVHAYNYLYHSFQPIRDEMESRTYDSVSMNQNLVKWANEFEEKNRGTDWDEHDFLIEVMSFTACKLAKELDIMILYEEKRNESTGCIAHNWILPGY